MPIYSSQMGGAPAAGGLYRKLKEQRASMEAIPEGKGAIGTMTRNLVEEPIERPVAPGAKKVVGVRPSTQPTENRGILPQNSASEGSVAGPSAMGMISPVAASTSRIAPRATSKGPSASTPSKGNGGSNNVPVSPTIKPKSTATTANAKGQATYKAGSPNVLGASIEQPLSRFTGGGPTAGLEDVSLYGTKEQVSAANKAKEKESSAKKNLPSSQAQRAANTKFTPATVASSLRSFASNPVKEAPKAAQGIVERVKETITNAVKGSGTYNQSVNKKVNAYEEAKKALEKAKSVLRSITKGWWS